MKNLYILIFSLLIFNNIYAQLLEDNITFNDFININQNQDIDKSDTKLLYLNKAFGNLEIKGIASKSPYEVYFILPIAYREQAPIWLDIQCPEMINYKFVHLDSINVFVVAQLNNSSETIHLNWTSWVMVKQHDYSGIPSTVSIPVFNDLPESVKPWLMPTGCVQWTDPFIQSIADSIRGTTNDLIVLADRINNYSYQIPWTFPVEPISFDAYYAMKWGNSCTGHAHAAAALFRANGIPCRVLLNMPTWYSGNLDMHWSIEYYIPQYGWVIMEPSLGLNPYNNGHKEIIAFACNPEDEFSMTYPDNIESYWLASDTVFQSFYPDWGGAHGAAYQYATYDTIPKVDSIISLTGSIYRYFTAYQGINLTSTQSSYFQLAKEFQFKAYNHIKSGRIDSSIYYLNQSLYNYRNIESNPLQTIFFDDFENGVNGWTHEGVNDKWELGSPTHPGPSNAYSGNSCWGTDLESNYLNNADCWLLSPSINLNKLSCAFLSVKIWNDVEDSLQGYSSKDKLWIELSTDNGATFFPITTFLGGVIDYNTGVPQVGGWSRLVLDLTPYSNHTLRIKFHFTSNYSITRAGSYIDDVHIYGKEMNANSVDESKKNLISIKCYPNPSSGKITLEILNPNGKSNITILNINGQELSQKQIYENKTQLDISNLPRGIYLLKLINENGFIVEKIIKE